MNKFSYRVLYISNSSDLDGAPRSLIDMITNFQNDMVIPFVLIPDKGKIEKLLKKNNIKYFVVHYKRCVKPKDSKSIYEDVRSELLNIKMALEIVKIIKQYNIDIVHTNSMVNDVGAMAAKISKKPHIWHVREDIEIGIRKEYINNFKIKYLIENSDTIITISRTLYNKYKQKYKEANIRYVTEGFKTSDYKFMREECFPNKAINVICCGTICENKGQLQILKAVHILKDRGYHNINVKLIGMNDQKYLSTINAYAKNHNLKGNLIIKSFEEDLYIERMHSDISVVSSRSEGFGRITVESMLSSLFVIGADTAATNEIIRDGYNGFLYEYGNVYDLADKIEYLIKNKQEVKNVVYNALEFAEKNYRIEELVRKISQIYADTAKSR